MTETFDVIDPNTIMKYAFRFSSSDKLVHLTQEQLDCIPYLAALVAHKDDMSSIENENGEYVLNPPIHYQWFMPILHSITSKNPYTLFNELSKDNNIFDTLQLFDYLGINSFPLPLLKYENLMRSNSTNTEDSKTSIEYHKANLSEARQSAAEFIIALSKNEYNLRDSHTVNCIFLLIKVILFEVAIFSPRFRHHALVVTKECCYSFFSKKQQHLPPTTQQIAQYGKDKSFIYLSDDNKPLPDDFHNTFAWRGVYVTIEEHRIDYLSVNSYNTYFTNLFERLCNTYEEQTQHIVLPTVHFGYRIFDLSSSFSLFDFDSTLHATELPVYYEITQDQKKIEAQAARSGHFNTLPKRPKIDKFKHRSGPKAQKYR